MEEGEGDRIELASKKEISFRLRLHRCLMRRFFEENSRTSVYLCYNCISIFLWTDSDFVFFSSPILICFTDIYDLVKIASKN